MQGFSVLFEKYLTLMDVNMWLWNHVPLLALLLLSFSIMIIKNKT